MSSHETGKNNKPRHKIRGEYIYNGKIYCDIFPREVLEKIPVFEFKSDDVIIATYPKCGTTWMQEILYGVVRGEKPAEGWLTSRVPFIELSFPGMDSLALIEKMPSPRLIKTHLATDFFKKAFDNNTKFIIVFRNLKDVIVSYYHYYRYIPAMLFKGDLDEFFEMFRDKNLCYGDWFDWVLDWWEKKDLPNVLVVFYEDMKADIKKETKRVGEFLGKDLTEEEVERIVEKASFDNMKANKMAFDKNEKDGQGQLRKGVVGDWSAHFNEEQRDYVNRMLEEKLAGTGLVFKDTM